MIKKDSKANVSAPVAAFVEEVAKAFEELAGRRLDHRLLRAWLQLQPWSHCAASSQVLIWHNLPGGLVVHHWLSLGGKSLSEKRGLPPSGCCCCC